MPGTIREMLEDLEERTLHPRAARASQSRGRARPEAPDEERPCFQRDRDRLVHSKAFRRLAGKTQVFLAPKGDHYRTRPRWPLWAAGRWRPSKDRPAGLISCG